ncbi:MAG: MFS transporter [Actinobacteria bacterium]|nr:MFS transporter [Actinomycetota bacterium]MBU4358744.1 MFS transporter [Actinomycetota bacterium]MBU4393183.1 MFS transporter [Actinomycetota bacterium]MBU4403607.1 MFS transporter [Actinomycetota bacterium]
MVDDDIAEVPIARSIRAFYPLVIVPGMVQVLAPATINSIMKDLGLTEGLGGLLQLVYFAGVLVGAIMITRLLQRITVKQLLLSQVLLLSVSLLACAVAPVYWLLLVFYVVTGFANGILVTAPGAYVTGMCGEESPRMQSMLYGFLALGIAIGPILPGLVARHDIPWRWALVAPAIMVLPLAVPLILTKLEHMHDIDKLSFKVLREVISFNRSLFIGLLVGLCLFAAAKSSIAMWLVRFLESEDGVAPGVAHLVLIALAVAVTVGRWLSSYVSTKVKPFNLLVFLTLSSAVIVLIAPLPSSRMGSIIMYPLMGLACAGIYPFLLGYAAWFPDKDSSAVFTSFFAAGAIGGALFPYAVGILNQFIDPRFGMASISFLILGVLACLYWIKPHVTDGDGGSGGNQ